MGINNYDSELAKQWRMLEWRNQMQTKIQKSLKYKTFITNFHQKLHEEMVNHKII